MVKINHIADVHLEKRLESASYPLKYAKERREEVWFNFNKFISNNESDFILICGDLFEAEYFDSNDFHKLNSIFENNSNTKIIICPGNHDRANNYLLYNLAKNVYVFTDDSLTFFEFPELNTRIYGIGWVENSYKKIHIETRLDEEFNNILMLHTDVFNDSGYMNISIDQLNRLGFDYIALGHIHKAQKLSDNIIYSGCFEPSSFGEIGSKGYVDIVLGGPRLASKFIPYSSRRFLESHINIDENYSEDDILKLIKEESRGKDFQRIHLSGQINTRAFKNLKWIFEVCKSSFYYVEFIDETSLYLSDEEVSDNKLLKYIIDYIDKSDKDSQIKIGAKRKAIDLLLSE